MILTVGERFASEFPGKLEDLKPLRQPKQTAEELEEELQCKRKRWDEQNRTIPKPKSTSTVCLRGHDKSVTGVYGRRCAECHRERKRRRRRVS